MRRRRRRSLPMVVVLIAVALVLWKHEQREVNGSAGGSSSGDTADVEQVDGSEARGTARAGRLSGPVTKIVDGDTLHVELAGSVTPKEKVRLLRINTPERGRPGFERATAALVALVEGKTVDLVFEDPAKPERDEYGRLLAYVWVGDVCANVELVRGGWTRFFTKYGEGRMAEEFRAAEADAQAAGAGLWNGDEWNAR